MNAPQNHRPRALALAAALLLILSPALRAAVAAHQYIQSYTDARTCAVCHPAAATQVMHTVHWTWNYNDPVTGKKLGKNSIINNYCIAVPSNEPRCTSCHIGWGYADKNFNFNEPANVDCLVCHDTTGTYKKFPTGAGFPVIGAAKEFPAGSGVMWTAPDLAHVARNAGKSRRANCGACHFFGGGGDAVKHGDLDSTMTNPSRELDFHMGTNSLNFSCATCHLPTNAPRHEVLGSPYTQSATATPLSCENCHSATPHKITTDWITPVFLNGHTARIACQTCHIPAFARGGKTTKMHWDWSTAGEKNPNGTLKTVKDAAGNTIYDTQKGTFVWQANVKPHYAWFDGAVDYVTMDTTVSSNQLVSINTLQGSRTDGKAKIYPTKRFTGMQPYDAGQNILAVPHLFPLNANDTNAYWKAYNWDRALTAGMAAVGRSYSGQRGWVRTEMYWVQNHMVAPRNRALRCNDCHTARGQLNFAALGYPADRAFSLQNMAGFEVASTTTAGPAPKTSLTWTTGPGFQYQVQCSTDLKNWTNVPKGLFIGGSTLEEKTWTDDSPSNARTFFRVVRTGQ